MNPQVQKNVYQADGKTFDSYEELSFYYWLQEAVQAKLVHTWAYHAKTFELAPKVVDDSGKFLLHDINYTPDFVIILGEKSYIFNRKTFPKVQKNRVWIDVKGTWGLHGDGVKFPILQKWMYQRHNIFVQKLVPEKFFKQTWVPRKCAYKRNGERRSNFKSCKLITDFIQDYLI